MSSPTFRGMPVEAFGHPRSDLRRELTELVLAGTKVATAGLAIEYELDGDPVPEPGNREVIADAEGRYVCVIETTRCEVARMAEVSDAFARDEGEGFADAHDWREAHERYWTGYIDELRQRLADPAWSLSDDTIVVCQWFRVVERFDPPIPAPAA
jgi:uncharacterized protein YhfF